MPREYLLFVRAGVTPLHPKWIAEDPERNWDCWVSWYCQEDQRNLVVTEYSSDEGSNKFEGFLLGRPSSGFDLARYRYVAMIDDDIDFLPGDISKAFALCDYHQLALAQPSLRWGSNVNHDVTLWNPLCKVRRVSFVEVMMPFFSALTLSELRDTFNLAKSTWGIDYAWASRLAHRANAPARIAILDSIRAHHTKPFDIKGGPFYRWLKSQGVDAEEEYGNIKARHAGFGGLRTLVNGHIPINSLCWVPDLILRRMVRLAESIKKRIHRRRLPKIGSI